MPALGQPLPNDPHAVSVSLPKWKDVIGYEEGDEETLAALQCGYPRFVLHPLVEKLIERAESEVARSSERLLLFPTESAATRCVEFVAREGTARIVAWDGLHAVVIPSEHWRRAFLYWRYCGEIISSRRAEAVLHGNAEPARTAEAMRKIRQRIASETDQNAGDVYLFPSGIASIHAAHRVITARSNSPARTIQLEFPYVDALKIQQEFGGGVEFIHSVEEGGAEQLDAIASKENISGVFCEVPSNPLLQTVDLEGVSRVLRPRNIPLIVDDTIGTSVNLDVAPWADLITTSLTKTFSGTGNVIAGALTLVRTSPLYTELKQVLDAQYENQLWGNDAVILERNSRDFRKRALCVNATAAAVFDFLQQHPAVEQVWYPKNRTPGMYQKLAREGGGYGGLISLLLKAPAQSSPRFYDALNLCKGPSLGTNFTLVSPYMLLAHYDELEWAESIGIDRHLIRISIGLESADELIGKLSTALDVLQDSSSSWSVGLRGE